MKVIISKVISPKKPENDGIVILLEEGETAFEGIKGTRIVVGSVGRETVSVQDIGKLIFIIEIKDLSKVWFHIYFL